MMTVPLIRFNAVSKAFPGVQALDHVSFDVRAGEIHVLMGENGAGKSTLMKILAGAYHPDSGSVEIDGHTIHTFNPSHAAHLGISMIYQELTVLDNLDVGRNIMLGREPVASPLKVMRWGKLYEEAAAILHDLKLDIDPRAPLTSLNIGERQMVEIARAASRAPRIMIMDEPTSSLGKSEEEVLFELIGRLKDRGVGIIYISHRMDEVFRLADRITVLRDGKHITTAPVAAFTRERLIQLMVGRDVQTSFARNSQISRTPIVELRGVSHGRLKDITLALYPGEVLGFAGLVGAGRTEVARTLFGDLRFSSGTISMHGQPLRLNSPEDAIRAGIAYVPDDRKGQGLVLMLPVHTNLMLAAMNKVTRAGVINVRRLLEAVQGWIAKLKIKVASPRQNIETLSGGNQQKVVLAKWLERTPRVLILNEPTRGIDVGAKAEVHQQIRDIAAQGVAVLVISSELPELLAISDRIAVMWNGRMMGEMPISEASEAKIIALAFGTAEQIGYSAGQAGQAGHP
jgi:ribose transport system ATP-binding protein